MKTTWLSIWITLAFLAAFLFAGVLTPETASSRAEHQTVAAQWQQRQIDTGAARPEPHTRPAWRDSGWAHTIQIWDHAAFKRINDDGDNRFFDAVMPGITKLGDGGVQAVGLIMLWWWARRGRRTDWMRTAVLAVSGLILSVVAPQMKALLPRYRPPSLFPYDIVLLVHPLYGGSFPSGHAMSSFAIATVIGVRHRWAAPPAFTLAAIIGLSRISVGVHWPLDVIGGAIIGVLLGVALARWGSQ